MSSTDYDAHIDYDAHLDYDGVTDVPDGGPEICNRLFMLNIGRGMSCSILFAAMMLIPF